jgi:antitoxin PrlF
MGTATITSKGQITIPIEIRTELGLKAGDQVFFSKNAQGRYVLYPKNGSVKALKGMFGKFPRALSIEEINEAIARGAADISEPDSGVETY